jgi:predicted transcriptional regulator
MSRNVALPDTSLEAYKALRPEQLRTMYAKIVEALKVLGTATYEQLSDYINCQDRNQISRRLKEMEGLQIIFKPGNKRLTKRGRNAYVYALTNSSQPKTEKEIVYRSDEKASTDYSKQLIHPTQLSLL